jgi:signal transduction histidine kinase
MSSPVAILAHDRRIAEALLEISNAVGSVMDIEDILQRICDIGARVMQTNTCSIYLIDEDDPGFLILRASYGLSRAQELGVRGFRVGEGPPGWAAAENQTLVLRDATNDFRNAKLDDTAEEQRYIAYICTPLRIQEEIVGVLSIRREHPTDWREEEAVFAEIVAKQIAIVLEKSRLYREKVEAERLAAIAISLSEVAHYIKNILQNMIGGAYFIEIGLKRGNIQKAQSGWELLQRNVEKIKTLVENMLRFSRERTSTLADEDLNSLVAEVARTVDDRAASRGTSVIVELDDHIPTLQLDKEAFTDALLNLVSNALDAIPDDRLGEVRIITQLERDKRRVLLTVADNGNGIPDEVRHRIFNLFFSTKGKGGTGIGLAVTRKIILEHGGQIWFESEQGHGTKFLATLPV